MIGRKTALACAALIAVMLAAAAWRIFTLDDWTTLADNGTTLPSLLLLFFPGCSALVVGSLYLNAVRATADAAKLRAWHKWGKLLALNYCAGMLLLQFVLIAATAKVGMLLHVSAIARTLGLVMAIVAFLSVNYMPKLPYLEPFGAGRPLGPIYGPRYVRTVSRILVAFVIAVTAYSLAAPSNSWRWTLVIVLLATAGLTVWSIAWGRHLGRKWNFEQCIISKQQSVTSDQ